MRRLAVLGMLLLMACRPAPEPVVPTVTAIPLPSVTSGTLPTMAALVATATPEATVTPAVTVEVPVTVAPQTTPVQRG